MILLIHLFGAHFLYVYRHLKLSTVKLKYVQVYRQDSHFYRYLGWIKKDIKSNKLNKT